MPSDVIVAGAGPAGTLCATLLARAGARVTLFDREAFPRSKLCGDTLNPGAMRVLAAVQDTDAIVAQSLPLDGMTLTGPGVSVRATYGEGIHGRAITRVDLDALLLNQALRAGAEFCERTTVVAPTLNSNGHVNGVTVRGRDGRPVAHRATLVIAADGRSSVLARALKLAHHPPQPRRWAIGGYFANAQMDRRVGEMHVRREHYIGIAPVPGDLANVCLVVPHRRGDGGWRDASALLHGVIARDPVLRRRLCNAHLVDRPQVLGPMAVEASAAGVPGLLLAGDAGGFVDPITGDGLRLALQSATLAADVARRLLAGLDPEAAVELFAAARRSAFQRKLQFNRTVRALVATPAAIAGAAFAARVAPFAFRRVIQYAGDCAA